MDASAFATILAAAIGAVVSIYAILGWRDRIEKDLSIIEKSSGAKDYAVSVVDLATSDIRRCIDSRDAEESVVRFVSQMSGASKYFVAFLSFLIVALIAFIIGLSTSVLAPLFSVLGPANGAILFFLTLSLYFLAAALLSFVGSKLISHYRKWKSNRRSC